MMALTRAVESQALAAMVAREPDLVAEERWAAIPGYEDTYCISETGRVWSKPRPTTSGGLLTRRFDRHGYPHVTLVQGGKQKRHKLHALVMLAFVGPRPEGMEIRHLDGSRDPHLPILAYGTHAENMRDVVEHGLHPMQQIASCPHGHPYDEANTYVWRGRRFCKACRHNQYRARRDGGVQ